MKRQSTALRFIIILICIIFLPSCSNTSWKLFNNELKSVKHVGQTPDEFKAIVENNTFKDVTAFKNVLLKSEICTADKQSRSVVQQVRMMDLYGKDLAEYTLSSDDAYHIDTLTATADGGFLFVLGFEDYAYDQNIWASDKGYASHVIKCDKYGNLQFDTPFKNAEGSALRFCFEKDGRFYLFGTKETPETNIRGIYSPTDIYMAILDKNGKILKNRCIAGSDYDNLRFVEISGNHFILSISSQSDDGDFAGSNSNGYGVSWIVEINDELEIIEKIILADRDYFFDERLGEKDGVPICESNPIFNNFDAGSPQAFIDYGDFYMIVSENNTGIYNKTPSLISSIWYYTETVYSAYDCNDKLIFRTSVDSSPDYDSRSKDFVVSL